LTGGPARDTIVDAACALTAGESLAISGNAVGAALVSSRGRSFSVYVVDVTLAESLAGVLLSVPKLVRSRRLDPGSAWRGYRMSYSKESPWHREL